MVCRLVVKSLVCLVMLVLIIMIRIRFSGGKFMKMLVMFVNR